MEFVTISEDILTFYVQATSFPEGVLVAWQTLHKMMANPQSRTYYGISHPDNAGKIKYMAAVLAENESEARQYGCPSFTVRKGRYVSKTLKNYMENPSLIAETFQELLQTGAIAKDGYCLEMFTSDNEMKCLVLLEN